MIKKTRETTDQTEKRKIYEELQKRLQDFVDQKDSWQMAEFRESWNKKNNEKIQELVKIQDRMICRFNKNSLTINIKTMTI